MIKCNQMITGVSLIIMTQFKYIDIAQSYSILNNDVSTH